MSEARKNVFPVIRGTDSTSKINYLTPGQPCGFGRDMHNSIICIVLNYKTRSYGWHTPMYKPIKWCGHCGHYFINNNNNSISLSILCVNLCAKFDRRSLIYTEIYAIFNIIIQRTGRVDHIEYIARYSYREENEDQRSILHQNSVQFIV